VDGLPALFEKLYRSLETACGVSACGGPKDDNERRIPLYELVVLSGKGGTGKTSVTASLAALSGGRAILADCDVDAANLELVLGPTLRERGPFSGGRRAIVDATRCTGCGKCAELCRFEAIELSTAPDGHRLALIDPPACEGCGVCERFCPAGAISMQPVDGGAWFLSDTRHGPLVHARLTPGLGNSGKLATLVRERAKREAQALKRPLVLVDGPPGVGCPVIATLTRRQPGVGRDGAHALGRTRPPATPRTLPALPHSSVGVPEQVRSVSGACV
jgi:MinD superfamily P-loop ATPase